MTRILPILLTLAISGAAAAQTVLKVDLAKDNGRGKPGQVVKSFAASDNPLHCVLHVKMLKGSMAFTGTLIAVNAGRVKDHTVATANVDTKPGTDVVDFKFSLAKPWPAGSYKVDIKAGPKLLREIDFEIG